MGFHTREVLVRTLTIYFLIKNRYTAGMAGQPKVTTVDRRESYYQERIRPHGTRYAEFHAPSVHALLDLIYTHDVASSYLARRLGKYRLSLSAFNVLMILSRGNEKGCPLHEIGDLLLVSRANVTGLVDGLERRGLVGRSIDSQDRRIRIARITPKGKSLLEVLLPGHYTELQRICSGLNTREKSALRQLLNKLRRSIQSSQER
jgi:MarR family 2-MHQ and catechol resistance regulon transcriptional repressor